MSETVFTDTLLFGLTIFAVGLCVGSFLNVVIWRLPRDESVVFPPSRCPACRKRIRPQHLIPVVSWLWLGGRCRDCASPISARYPLVESATGLLFVWVYLRTGWSVELIAGLTLVSFLIVVAGIDFDHQLILNKVNLWFGAAGLAFSLITGRPGIWDAGFGAVLAGGLLLAIVLLTGGMGWGDVWYATAAGLWLGWQGTLVMLFLAFFSGGAVGALLLAAGVRKRKDAIAFGPFLCLGTLAAWFWWPQIIGWYWSVGAAL